MNSRKEWHKIILEILILLSAISSSSSVTTAPSAADFICPHGSISEVQVTTADPAFDDTYLVCTSSKHASKITEPRQFSTEDTSALTDAAGLERARTLKQIKDLYVSFSKKPDPNLADLNGSCDPDMHKTWLKKNLFEDYVTTDTSWHGKVCNFFELLDCNPTTKLCECAASSIYGIDLKPLGSDPEEKETSYGPQGCVSDEHGLCSTYFLDPGVWPSTDFSVFIKIRCSEDHECLNFHNKRTLVTSNRCYKTMDESDTSGSASFPMQISLSLIYSFFYVLCLIS